MITVCTSPAKRCRCSCFYGLFYFSPLHAAGTCICPSDDKRPVICQSHSAYYLTHPIAASPEGDAVADLWLSAGCCASLGIACVEILNQNCL